MKYDMTFAEFKERIVPLFDVDSIENSNQEEYEQLITEISNPSIMGDDETLDYMDYTFVVLTDGVYRIPFYIEEDDLTGASIRMQVQLAKKITVKDKQSIQETIDDMKMRIQSLEGVLSALE